MILYNKYSDHLKAKYGCKVYKLPIELNLTCPNRISKEANSACTYCGGIGAGFENLSSKLSVTEQITLNKERIGKKYKAEKFIVYFQNFTNTYLPLEEFKSYINEVIHVKNNFNIDIVEIAIATRPDCVNDKYLDFLKIISVENDISILIEMGLQTANYNTLEKVNRGHSLAEFIDSVLRIKPYGFLLCVHLIPNLPYDGMSDVIETSKIISVLKIDFVKLHALYIVKNSPMAQDYLDGKFTMCDHMDYVEKVITFIEYSCPDIVYQRIIGRVPEEESVFANWGMSWWKINDIILSKMEAENRYQGKLFNYTNGHRLNVFDN